MEKVNVAILELHYVDTDKIDKSHDRNSALARAFCHFGYKTYAVFPKKHFKVPTTEVIQGASGGRAELSVLWMPVKSYGDETVYELDFLTDLKIGLVILRADNRTSLEKVLEYCRDNEIYVITLIEDSFFDIPRGIRGRIKRHLLESNLKLLAGCDVYASGERAYNELTKREIKSLGIIRDGLDTICLPKITKSRQETRQILGLPVKKLIVMYEAELENENKPFRLLEVARSLDKTKYHFVIIGDGSLKKYFIDAVAGLLPYTYKEKATELERAAYCHASDFYLSLNERAEYDVSLLRPMFYRSVLMAIRAPGPNAVIEDTVDGYLCGSPIKIADWMNHELEYEWNRQQVTDKAYERLVQNKSTTAMAVTILARFGAREQARARIENTEKEEAVSLGENNN